jgi:hypothetical protein
MNPSIKGIALFLELQKAVFETKDLPATRYRIVNETHHLFSYRQALLWECKEGITAASGVSYVDKYAPFIVWINALCDFLSKDFLNQKPLHVKADSLPLSLSQEWTKWFPKDVIWAPLVVHGNLVGALLLSLEAPYNASQEHLLEYLTQSYAYALWAGNTEKQSIFSLRSLVKKPKFMLSSVAVLLGIFCFPVSYSAIAPAYVISKDPYVVRASLDGVVENVAVKPNTMVRTGESLITLDQTTLQSRLEVAEKNLEITETEYRQVSQMALYDVKQKAQMAIAKGKMEQAKSEVDYTASLLEKTLIKAPYDGLVIMDDAHEWIGKPVKTGERIMNIADVNETQLEIWLGINDAIALQKGSTLKFFLNTAPHAPLEAQIAFISYEPKLDPSGLLAYRIHATWIQDHTKASLGLKGNAKMYGDKTLLGIYILRRPMAILRQWMGM